MPVSLAGRPPPREPTREERRRRVSARRLSTESYGALTFGGHLAKK
jgi:hypothetical protein